MHGSIRSSLSFLTLFSLLLTAATRLNGQSSDPYDQFDIPGSSGPVAGAALLPDGTFFIRGGNRVDTWVDEEGEPNHVPEFTGVQGNPDIRSLAKWTGNRWDDLGIVGSSVSINGTEYSLSTIMAASGDDLYIVAVTERYTGSNYLNHLLRLHNGTWTVLGNGLKGQVRRLRLHSGTPYLSGSISHATRPDVQGLVRWNGADWEEIGGGLSGNSESNFEVRDFGFDVSGNLFAFGTFTAAGSVNVNGGARWSGNAWKAVGDSAVNIFITSVAIAGSTPYGVVGERHTAGIYKLEGTSWLPIEGPAAGIDLMGVDSLQILHAVAREEAGANGIYRYVGGEWQRLPGAFSGSISDVEFGNNGTMLVTGSFKAIDESVLAPGIAKWDGRSWNSVAANGAADQGLLGYAGQVEYLEGYVYVGGSNLRTVDHPRSNGMLRWSEIGGWEEVGGGLSGYVSSIVPHNRGLLVSGCFWVRNNPDIVNVAFWDGSAWHGFGDGPHLCIADVAARDAHLFAVSDRSLVEWNGETWQELSRVDDGELFAVAANADGTVYVGGRFNTAGGTIANGIAAWKNGTWQSLGSGFRMQVRDRCVLQGKFVAEIRTLSLIDSYLYAGGTFDSAGSGEAFQIARWDGSDWEGLGGGPTGSVWLWSALQNYPEVRSATVRSIRSIDGTIFAGGTGFRGAGALCADAPERMQLLDGVCWWDEENGTWNPVTNGDPDTWAPDVHDFAVSRTTMVAVGPFVKYHHRNPSHSIAFTTIPERVLDAPTTPALVEFGVGPVHRETIRTVTVHNPASSTRTLIGRAVITGGPFRTVGDGTFHIAPGTRTEVPIAFYPTTQGALTGSLRIDHNADDPNPLTVYLTGIGGPLSVSMSVNRTAVDFGTRVRNASDSIVEITIRCDDQSNAPLTIDPHIVQPPFYINDRKSSTSVDFPPHILEPGEEATLVVTMTAEQIGVFHDELVIEHDAAPGGRLTIPLFGTIQEIPPPVARLDVTEQSLDFDSIPNGNRERIYLTVKNHPTSDIPGTAKLLPISPPFSTEQEAEVTIVPGDSAQFGIIFAPHSSKRYEQQLGIVLHIGDQQDTVFVPVTGTATPTPKLALHDDQIYFENVEVGRELTINLVVDNSTTTDDNLTLTHGELSPPFSVEWAEISVRPGRVESLGIRFRPQAEGSFTDTLLLYHNDPNYPSPIPIYLFGNGVKKTTGVGGGTQEADRPDLSIEPNPAAAYAVAHFTLPKAGYAVLELHSLQGATVSQLSRQYFSAGAHEFRWSTAGLPSGTYYCSIIADGVSTTIPVHILH